MVIQVIESEKLTKVMVFLISCGIFHILPINFSKGVSFVYAYEEIKHRFRKSAFFTM